MDYELSPTQEIPAEAFLPGFTIPPLPSMFTFRRHRPRRSKSRWFKCLEKRMPYAKIIAAHPKSPFMTVQWRPRNEEEKKLIEEANIRMMMTLGACMVVPALAFGLGNKA